MSFRPRKAVLSLLLNFAACLVCGHASPQRQKPLLHTERRPLVRTLPLNKQRVPVHRRGRIVAHKTAYSSTIFVGGPSSQPFTVVFDTGSGHAFLPSSDCVSDVCMKRRRYQRNMSSTAVDIDERGHEQNAVSMHPVEVELVYGTGKVSGGFIREVVCLSDESAGPDRKGVEVLDNCMRLGFISATKLTAEPFEQFSFDGVVGLGLSGLALHRDFSFFGRLYDAGSLPEPCFSIFLAKSDDSGRSEIAFGGHNQDHAASAFQWAPVAAPEQGYWQVAIRSVRVGNQSVNLCASGACRAVLDSGTSMLGIPEESTSLLHRLLARPVGQMDADCRKLPGPPLIFDLGDFELQLGAEEYSRPAPMLVKHRSGIPSTVVCRSSLMTVPSDVGDVDGAKVFVFGEPFFHKHYTKYDWLQRRVGFAQARQSDEDM